jgi:ABC-2 type transport system ATP-binding protein
MLGNPKLLILDEPTNGLDPAGIQEIRELIRSLPQQYGMTVLVSSHMLNEIDQIANNLGIIRQGELVLQGPFRCCANEASIVSPFGRSIMRWPENPAGTSGGIRSDRWIFIAA